MQEPVVTGERPLVQSVVRALARLWRRPLWLAGLIVILSVPLWLAARPWVTQRVLCFDFTPAGAGLQWVVEWERGSDGLKNGAWLDLPRLVGGTETLEIRPSGQPHEAGRSFEFWLYSVTPSRGPASSPDLKALVERPSDESLTGRWVLPPPAVPGIVYAGNQPGSLKLDLPPGNVTIAGAKTETGGGVEFRYADDSVTVDTYASPDQPLTVQLKRQTVPEGRVLQVRRPLPNYALSRVMLSWYDSPAARFSLENVKVQETIFGRRVRARSITPVAAQNVADAGRDGRAFRFVTSSTAGTVMAFRSPGPSAFRHRTRSTACRAVSVKAWRWPDG